MAQLVLSIRVGECADGPRGRKRPWPSTAIDTVTGIENATSNIAAGNASLGDALVFLPILTVGVQKLRGAPTNCFIAGTLVAVAGVNSGTGTADAGPSSASKLIEEIQVGDFVWAQTKHDPSAPAVLQKVVALYRKAAHDLQKLEVVGEQGSASPLVQSVQIVAIDDHRPTRCDSPRRRQRRSTRGLIV